ncbi:MAG: L-seryl-tRNA(Sec) selenium transferase [Betaproteobacteria bacterium]|nr:L-seryl-tRNA(Sec) selenium transferase [Betaproteobacteria bacterium]
MLNPAATARRAIPSVDRLLKLDPVGALIAEYGRPLVVETIRAVLDEQRALLNGDGAVSLDENSLLATCSARLHAATSASLKPVFNLTGTVLHTNLGRALLPQTAAQAALMAMTRAVNLEFDLGGGARGERDSHVEAWLKRLTGAETALVVNNNAAAVYLVLNTLALRKEVIVSRGELIEIGGAFRIPDIMARAGCRLREVGTTNRTHARDYTQAVSTRTAAIMKVHASNYAIQGFTASVPEDDLAAIAREHELPFLIDLGSGSLVDLERYGLPHEPTPRETIANGADVVTFSGDKLLGGPQCGLIVGRKELIAKIRKNPMKRALRVDKVTLAALEATLRLYADPERLTRELPTLRLLTRPRAEIETQAQRVLPAIVAAVAGCADAQIIACASQIGSGALPVEALPSAGIALTPRAKRKGTAAAAIADAFRALPVPVIGRIKGNAFILDLRCLDDEAGFIAQLHQLKIQSLATEVTEHTEKSKTRSNK